MTTVPNGDLRSFREVGIVLTRIRQDIEELKDAQKNLMRVMVGSLLCPMLVGSVLTYLFK